MEEEDPLLKFYPDDNLVCWWPSETVDRDAVIAYYTRLRDCPWGDRANRFCDFSRVTDFSFNYSGLASLAAIRKRELKEHRDHQLVTYSDAPLGYGMARMYQALMEDWPIETHVVKRLEEASHILGVKPGLLAAPEPV